MPLFNPRPLTSRSFVFSWFKDQTQNHMDAFTDFSTALDLVADATDEVRPVPGFAQDSLLYPDLPAHLYHADRDALSCSLLKPLLVSPAHFQAALTATQSSSDAKDFGTLLHLLLLQPHLTGQEVAVYPEIVSPLSRDYKAFLECNSHKLVVDEPTFTKARLLADKVRETRYKGRPLGLFLEEAQTEVSIYFTEPTTGLRLRVRHDIFHPDLAFDLKSTRHPSVGLFTRDAVKLDYDLQAFMYSLARSLYEGTSDTKPFVFIAAESSEPFSVHTLAAGGTFLTNGAKKFQECLSVYKACSVTGHWPDLSSDGEIEIDHWQQYTPTRAWAAGQSAA